MAHKHKIPDTLDVVEFAHDLVESDHDLVESDHDVVEFARDVVEFDHDVGLAVLGFDRTTLPTTSPRQLIIFIVRRHGCGYSRGR